MLGKVWVKYLFTFLLLPLLVSAYDPGFFQSGTGEDDSEQSYHKVCVKVFSSCAPWALIELLAQLDRCLCFYCFT